ncbi:MAG: hypothetical protein U9Q79_05495 [Candidatus Hydrogenedentes bacterium]|nr:hypothetical protein [Candidatus Hydrogenedentota bacterium]
MSEPMCNQRNDVRLLTRLDGEDVSHFRLREFENRAGLAMVHPALLESLERVRRDLCEMAGETIWIIITDGVRTQEDLERLAARYGWVDEGGTVARNSKHLVKFGGIAADLVAVNARTRQRVSQKIVGTVCGRHFDWVKGDYNDGHVHADNRYRVHART